MGWKREVKREKNSYMNWMDVVACVRVSACVSVCLCSWYWKCWQWQCGFSVLVFLTHSHYQAVQIPCLCLYFIYWMFGLVCLTDDNGDLCACECECERKTHITYMNKRALTTQQNHFISSILMCVYIKIVHCLFSSCYFNIEKVLFPFLSFLTCSPINKFVFSFCQLWPKLILAVKIKPWIK